MADSTIAFPTRPLTVSPPASGFLAQLSGWFWAALLAGGAIGVVIPPIPDIVSDFAVRETARPVEGASVADGSCSVHMVVITDCEATLIVPRDGHSDLRRTVHAWFFDLHAGDYTVSVVADPSRPEQLTTDLALAKLWNRTVTLLLVGPLMLLLGAFAVKFFLFGEVRDRRAVVRALSNQVLRPAMLRLDRRGPKSWTVSHLAPSGDRTSLEWEAKGAPVVMDGSQGLVLGVTTGDGSSCMPLDAKLSWLGLTDAERQQLTEQLGAR